MHNNSNIINHDKYIPIVFALDDGFAMPTSVAIASMLKNKKETTRYKIYLITPGLSLENIKKLKSQETKDCSIIIIENNNAVKNFSGRLENVTNTDYYRLMLDTFIPETKIIALDGDIVVLDDLSELYNIELGENVIGGCYFRPHDVYNRKYVKENLGLDEGKRINIGVMLMDLSKLKTENIQDKFIQNIGKFKVMSEDIINYVCKNRIKLLPIKYNYTLHFEKYHKLLKNCPVYSAKEYKNARRKPVVFHYTLFKPWKTKCYKHKLWIKYLKNSPYSKIQLNLSKENFFEFTNNNEFLKIKVMGIKIHISK